MLLHYLAKHGNIKITYFDSENAVLPSTALPKFNQVLLDFFSVLDL